MRVTVLLPFLLTGCFDPFAALFGADGDDDDGSFFEDLFEGPKPAAVEHQSRTWGYVSGAYAEPQGLAPMSADDSVWVGMSGMVCDVSFTSGDIGTDYDPDPRRPERVSDWDDGRVVAVTPRGYHMASLDDEPVSVRRPGTLDVRLIPGGVLVIAEAEDGGCVAEFDGVTTTIPTCPNPDGVAVNPNGPSVWASDGGVVSKVEPSGTVETTPVQGDLLAYDAELGVLYSAWAGEVTVSAWEPNGALRWEVTLSAPVQRIRAVTAEHAVAVQIDPKDGGSELWMLDADTGEAREVMRTGPRMLDVAFSPDASKLALATRASSPPQ